MGLFSKKSENVVESITKFKKTKAKVLRNMVLQTLGTNKPVFYNYSNVSKQKLVLVAFLPLTTRNIARRILCCSNVKILFYVLSKLSIFVNFLI